jgi:anti-anti-sigma regulatory factor
MGTETVILDCARLNDPDVSAVDCIARRVLDARRDGCECRLAHASDELLDLIELTGLGEVLRVEVRRESEQGEQPGRVQEERELADPSA